MLYTINHNNKKNWGNKHYSTIYPWKYTTSSIDIFSVLSKNDTKVGAISIILYNGMIPVTQKPLSKYLRISEPKIKCKIWRGGGEKKKGWERERKRKKGREGKGREGKRKDWKMKNFSELISFSPFSQMFNDWFKISFSLPTH